MDLRLIKKKLLAKIKNYGSKAEQYSNNRVLLKLQFLKNFHSKTAFCAVFWNKMGAIAKTSSETNQVSEEV